MKKYLRNITVGTALALVAGSCTGNFEEYNTNQFQIHEADPSTLMKSMIETIVNIQQNDSQMMDQMVGQLGGYLTCANVWSGTNFGTFIKAMPGMQVPGIPISRKYTVISFRYRKQPMKAVIIMLLHV